MQISFVMLLFSDQISGGAPPSVEESQLTVYTALLPIYRCILRLFAALLFITFTTHYEVEDLPAHRLCVLNENTWHVQITGGLFVFCRTG